MAKSPTTVDATATIVDAFLTLPIGEALTLHTVIGRVLHHMGGRHPVIGYATREEAMAAPPVPFDQGGDPIPPSGYGPPSHSTAVPRQRRRRRTRAEMNAGEGPATNRVEVPEPAVVDSTVGDPGLPGEEMGG